STWNEFLFALIVLNSDQSKTIPVGLLNFQGQFANNNTGLAAGILIAVVPILLAYVILQRWIVGGLTAGAPQGEGEYHHESTAGFRRRDLALRHVPRPLRDRGLRAAGQPARADR